MKLTAKLAYSQLKVNRNRSTWTFLGIVLAAAMTAAVCGFAVSGDIMLTELEVDKDRYMPTLTGLSVILGLIIAVVSVTVVSNAFRVSADERTAQFGILKSVGATKKQVAATVMYEGVLLCLIGIPIGIALGIAVHYSGIGIANYFLKSLNSMRANNNTHFYLRFETRWWAVLIAAVGSFLTVMLSAWLPARKAAKIPAIDAIRGAGTVRISAKKVRVGGLVRRIFGFEGTLAVKSLKRSRGNFRASVISLTVSVMLYIMAGSIGVYGNMMTNEIYPNLDIDAICFCSGSVNYDDGVFIGRDMMSYAEAEEFTKKLNAYPDAEAYRVGTGVAWSVELPEEFISPKMRAVIESVNAVETINQAVIVTVDSAEYERLCKVADVPSGSNILINSVRFRLGEKRTRTVLEPYVFKETTLRIEDYQNVSEPLDLPIHGELTVGEVPEEIMSFVNNEDVVGYINFVCVIVPEADSMSTEWLVKTADPDGFLDYAYGIFDGGRQPFYSENVRDAIRAMKDLRNLLLTFVYGFVGMLTLVALTNVISTISANIRSRSKEFAILRSSGLTEAGLRKMLNLESAMSSARALLFGLPLGCGLSYLIYYAIKDAVDFPYVFPSVQILQCVLGVFAVAWIVMRYAARKLRGGSIVEAVRGEYGNFT